MKKFEVRSLLAFLLVAMLVFAFAACGGTEDTLPPDSGTDPVVTDPVEIDPVETDPIETDPVVTDPVETDPPATEPVETEPPVTEPVETTPPTTEPVETAPVETEPVSTECEHKYGSGKRINATCQSEGRTEYTCSKCGEVKIENVIPKVDHLYTETYITYPSCTSEGEAVDQCSFCGDTKNARTIPMASHEIETKNIDNATPTHHSAEVAYCKKCGMISSVVAGEAHDFSAEPKRVADQYTAAGYVTYGFELYECACGYQYKINSNHADGHFFEYDVIKAKYVCKCGADIGEFVDNGNEKAGPVVFRQD